MANTTPIVETDDPFKNLQKIIAIFSSTLALMSAFAGLMTARCTTRGMHAKNEAILIQSQITDEWAFYQSRSMRIEFAELSINLLPSSHKKVIGTQEKIAGWNKEKDVSFNKARTLEIDRGSWNVKAEAYLDNSKTFASALALLQVAVVLIPMTLIIRQKSMLHMGGFLGVGGLIFLIQGYIEFIKILAS